jgi:hypothetical protein
MGRSLEHPTSRQEKKKMRSQDRSAWRMAKKMVKNTSILKDSTASLADQPITSTGWMGVGAHHRNVKDFQNAWDNGEHLYEYLRDFQLVPFQWIRE